MIVFIMFITSACDIFDQKPEIQQTLVSTTPPELPEILLSKKIVDSKKMLIEKACFLDTINGKGGGKYQIKLGQVLTLSGWAFNSLSGNEPSNKIFIEFLGPNGSFYYKALRTYRVDIAQAFKKPKINNSGFSATTLTNNLNPENYKIRIIQLDQAHLLICDTSWNLQINAY